MSEQDFHSRLDEPDMRGVYPALLRAGERARELAVRTGTPTFVIEGGKAVAVPSGAEAVPEKK